MKLIYILGADGAGKTSHAKKFVNENEKKRVKYLYLQYFPFILKPIKFFAKKKLLNNVDEFKDYSKYSEKKKEISSHKYLLTRLYTIIWYFDYCLQILPKIYYFKYFTSFKALIIDRYYLDTITHTAYLLNLDKNKILREAKFLEHIFPKADFYFFLKVSPEIAFNRKSDIQSIEYLIEREKIYFIFKEYYNFIMINADKDIDSVYNSLKKQILSVIS